MIPWATIKLLPINEVHTSPQFTMANMTALSDKKAVNDFKNISQRAYPLFRDGHIATIYIRMHLSREFYY